MSPFPGIEIAKGKGGPPPRLGLNPPPLELRPTWLTLTKFGQVTSLA